MFVLFVGVLGEVLMSEMTWNGQSKNGMYIPDCYYDGETNGYIYVFLFFLFCE